MTRTKKKTVKRNRSGILSAEDKITIQEMYLRQNKDMEDIATSLKRSKSQISRYINTFLKDVNESIEIKDKKRASDEEKAERERLKACVEEARERLMKLGLTRQQASRRIHKVMSQDKPPKSANNIFNQASKILPITDTIITRSQGNQSEPDGRQVAIMTHAGSEHIDETRKTNRDIKSRKLAPHIFRIISEDEGRY